MTDRSVQQVVAKTPSKDMSNVVGDLVTKPSAKKPKPDEYYGFNMWGHFYKVENKKANNK